MQIFKTYIFLRYQVYYKNIIKFYERKIIFVLQIYINTYSLILKSKLPTHKRLSST